MIRKMSKKKGTYNIPDEDLVKSILEGAGSDDESASNFGSSESIEFSSMPEDDDYKTKFEIPSDNEDRPTPITGVGSIPSKMADELGDMILEGLDDPDSSSPKADDRTIAINSEDEPLPLKLDPTDIEKTIAVTAFAKRKKPTTTASEEKVVIGMARPTLKAGLVHTSMDASLAQAENLKIAQQRIIELEKELDRLRSENEELASAGHIMKQKAEDLNSKVLSSEKERREAQENLENEISILKGSLHFKDNEYQKSKIKIEELEIRLKSDFKKIRVRERELENRLELARAEKQALVRTKDDTILELQRKIDHIRAELDTYREKVQELNKTVEAYQDQMKRTVRALRLALTNLEVKDESFIALKKAE